MKTRNDDGELVLRGLIDGVLDDILENPSSENFSTLKDMINAYEKTINELQLKECRSERTRN